MSFQARLRSLSAMLKAPLFLFILMGTFSTCVMYLLYIVLNFLLPYQMSYLISYVVTVVLSYVLNTRYVFKRNMSWRTFIQFPLVYVIQYVMGALSLEILVRLGFSVTFAPCIILIVLLPLTFVLSKIILM